MVLTRSTLADEGCKITNRIEMLAAVDKYVAELTRLSEAGKKTEVALEYIAGEVKRCRLFNAYDKKYKKLELSS